MVINNKTYCIVFACHEPIMTTTPEFIALVLNFDLILQNKWNLKSKRLVIVCSISILRMRFLIIDSAVHAYSRIGCGARNPIFPCILWYILHQIRYPVRSVFALLENGTLIIYN